MSYSGGNSWVVQTSLRTPHIGHKSLQLNDQIVHIDGCLTLDRWGIEATKENTSELHFVDFVPNLEIDQSGISNLSAYFECYQLLVFHKPGK